MVVCVCVYASVSSGAYGDLGRASDIPGLGLQ